MFTRMIIPIFQTHSFIGKCERKKMEKNEVIVAYEQGRKKQPNFFIRTCTKKKVSLDFDMRNKK